MIHAYGEHEKVRVSMIDPRAGYVVLAAARLDPADGMVVLARYERPKP